MALLRSTPYLGRILRFLICGSSAAALNTDFAVNANGTLVLMERSRFGNCSMVEAVRLSVKIAGRMLNWTYSESNRSGDHIWCISDVSKFKSHYPQWEFKYDIQDMPEQVYAHTAEHYEVYTEFLTKD